MPNVERAARHVEQKARLRGICLEGEYECSHSLLDSVVQQYERDELKYICLSSCTTRDQEVTGLKKDSQLAIDNDGQIKLRPSQSLAIADTSAELRLKNAMLRRAIAYDQSGLIDFEVHNRWIEKLFSAQMRTPPPGYRGITTNQMLEADRMLWKRLADVRRTGIVPIPGVPRPLDEASSKLMDSSEVMYFLLPLPQSTSSRSNDYGPENRHHNGSRFSPKGSKGYEPKGGKGGKSGKGNKGGFNPAQLGWPSEQPMKTTDGSRFCFNFNSKRGCKFAKPGQKCRNGSHLCCKYGCGGNHPQFQCKPSTN
jgi:hypothetical protein